MAKDFLELAKVLERTPNFLIVFHKTVDPNLLLPHLCLPTEHSDHVSNICNNKSKYHANLELWGYLRRRPDWPERLRDALKEEGYNPLLDQLLAALPERFNDGPRHEQPANKDSENRGWNPTFNTMPSQCQRQSSAQPSHPHSPSATNQQRPLSDILPPYDGNRNFPNGRSDGNYHGNCPELEAGGRWDFEETDQQILYDRRNQMRWGHENLPPHLSYAPPTSCERMQNDQQMYYTQMHQGQGHCGRNLTRPQGYPQQQNFSLQNYSMAGGQTWPFGFDNGHQQQGLGYGYHAQTWPRSFQDGHAQSRPGNGCSVFYVYSGMQGHSGPQGYPFPPGMQGHQGFGQSLPGANGHQHQIDPQRVSLTENGLPSNRNVSQSNEEAVGANSSQESEESKPSASGIAFQASSDGHPVVQESSRSGPSENVLGNDGPFADFGIHGNQAPLDIEGNYEIDDEEKDKKTEKDGVRRGHKSSSGSSMTSLSNDLGVLADQVVAGKEDQADELGAAAAAEAARAVGENADAETTDSNQMGIEQNSEEVSSHSVTTYTRVRQEIAKVVVDVVKLFY